jgi:hypothetical protein
MKKNDMLDFMEGIDNKYLEEVGAVRMRNTEGSNGTGKLTGRRGIIMELNKISIGVAILALVAGIGIGALLFTNPIKGDEAAEEIVEKYTPDGEIILPKGTPMTDQNAIIVPEEEWEETGLLSEQAQKEAAEYGLGEEIIRIQKWNIETDDGYETYYSEIRG